MCGPIFRHIGLCWVLRLALALFAMGHASAVWPQPIPKPPAPAAIRSYEAGLAARAAGQLQAALVLFEQALLYEPGFAGAWFDYALTMCDLGDVAGCRNVLAQAVERFGMPPLLRSRPSRVGRSQYGEIEVGLGASSNLLRATGLESLTLILNGQPIEALLDERYRERGGGYMHGAAHWQAHWPLRDTTLRLSLFGRRPHSGKLPGVTSGYAELSQGLRADTRVGALLLGIDEGYLGALASAGIWAEHDLLAQRLSLRASLEQRKPKGMAGWMTTRVNARLFPDRDTELSAGWEYDFPQASRAGGAQHRLLLDARRQFTLPELAGHRPRLTLGASILHGRDTEIYSPIFGDVRQRRTRYQLLSNIEVDLDRHWRLRFDLIAARQNASLGLFKYKEVSAQMSLVYRFH